jgi:hypothetical protein
MDASIARSRRLLLTCQCNMRVQRDIPGAYPVQPDAFQTLGVVRFGT